MVYVLGLELVTVGALVSGAAFWWAGERRERAQLRALEALWSRPVAPKTVAL